MIYISMYLGAIIAANLLVVTFGPPAIIINSFLFIGLDLTSRDKLHDKWRNNGLVWKMFILILSGGIISYFVNRDAGQIAFASTVSFILAAIVDSIAFHILRFRPQLQKINGSNIPSAMVDSIAFPTIAFGSFMPIIILGQFIAKITGGFFWSIIFNEMYKCNKKK